MACMVATCLSITLEHLYDDAEFFYLILEESTYHCKEDLIINSSLQEKMCRKYVIVMLTIPYLKVLFIVWFHKIFKLIFHKQATDLAPFSQVFLEKPLCRKPVNSCVICDLFPR